MIDYPDGQVWPPLPNAVTTPMAGWAAWYEGVPELLSAHYQVGLGAGALTPRVRPQQLDGGVVGALARFWWGQPQKLGSQLRGVHLPLAADIATASSDLLFGERLDLDYGIESVHDDTGKPAPQPAVERLEYILEENGWDSLLAEGGELQSALGGVYIRSGWDSDVADCPLITMVSADKAVPTFRYGRLQSVTFWEIVKVDGSRIWRHLERHEKGHIFHQLREGAFATLGKKLDLKALPATADLADDVPTQIDRLTVEYVPNVRPSRRWRNVPEGVNLGRADIDGTEPLLDSLDETWNSLMRDIRHGKSRIMASSSILAMRGTPGQGATVDLDQEVYEALNVPIGADASLSDLISAQQFPIRVTEHLQTIDALMGSIVRGAGYSGQTFGMDTAVAKTATEVDSVRDRTRQTREKKTRYWGPALQRVLRTILALDTAHFQQKDGGLEVHVEFPPEATPDSESTARTLQMLRTAEVISLETSVALLNPGWDDPMVAEEVERIQAEKKASTPSITVSDFMPDGPDPEDPANDPGDVPDPNAPPPADAPPEA